MTWKLYFAIAAALPLFAQPQTPTAPRPPAVVSPELSADRHITFRIYAPKAEAVRLNGGDIQGLTPATAAMTKSDTGIWELTVGPLVAGAYRYTFNVDGVPVIDPRNPATSESNANTWSLVAVPGSDFMDTRNVPHGAVASVVYYSTSLQRPRRMHVYTPPGYETNSTKYPVFYLLHGASDSDASWSSVGRANMILDNLIADKKAKPMIVVMPAGHTSTAPRVPGSAAVDEFIADFNTDILPYVEAHYRAIPDRAHRAIAGLSMGGSQTLNIAIPHLNQFAYVGVFSSGILGGDPGKWEEKNREALDDAHAKKGLKLFWFSTGKDDRLIENTRKSVEMLKTHGFSPVLQESAGAHTWLNWRDYLNEFTPQLFQ